MQDNNMKDRTTNIETAIQQGEERVKNLMADVGKGLKQGQEKVKNTAVAIDKQLHENPWPIVAGVAVGCILLGFVMGANKKN